MKLMNKVIIKHIKRSKTYQIHVAVAVAAAAESFAAD